MPSLQQGTKDTTSCKYIDLLAGGVVLKCHIAFGRYHTSIYCCMKIECHGL